MKVIFEALTRISCGESETHDQEYIRFLTYGVLEFVYLLL